MKAKKIEPVSREDGVTVLGVATEDAVDWLRAGRLRELASQGNEEARAELERMDNSPMFVIEEGS